MISHHSIRNGFHTKSKRIEKLPMVQINTEKNETEEDCNFSCVSSLFSGEEKIDGLIEIDEIDVIEENIDDSSHNGKEINIDFFDDDNVIKDELLVNIEDNGLEQSHSQCSIISSDETVIETKSSRHDNEININMFDEDNIVEDDVLMNAVDKGRAQSHSHCSIIPSDETVTEAKDRAILNSKQCRINKSVSRESICDSLQQVTDKQVLIGKKISLKESRRNTLLYQKSSQKRNTYQSFSQQQNPAKLSSDSNASSFNCSTEMSGRNFCNVPTPRSFSVLRLQYNPMICQRNSIINNNFSPNVPGGCNQMNSITREAIRSALRVLMLPSISVPLNHTENQSPFQNQTGFPTLSSNVGGSTNSPTMFNSNLRSFCLTSKLSNSGTKLYANSATIPSRSYIMNNLSQSMVKSQATQYSLEKFDKANGLPKSHSSTMVKTERSRIQLQKGIILKKWDGSPLITYKPGQGWRATNKRTRSKKVKNEEHHKYSQQRSRKRRLSISQESISSHRQRSINS